MLVSALALLLVAAAPAQAPTAEEASTATQAPSEAEAQAASAPRSPATDLGPLLHARNGALAFMPGLFVPGLGHRLGGDSGTANRLLTASLSGLGGLLAGGAMLIASGGTESLAAGYYPLLYCGATAFLGSWLADIAGSARPEGQGVPLAREESLRLAFRYGWRDDSYSRIDQLGSLEAGWETRHLLLHAEGWLAPGGGFSDLRARGGLKLWSDRAASHFAVLAEGSRRQAAGSDTIGLNGSLALELKLDLSHLGPSLAGIVFLERIGFGATSYRWSGGSEHWLEGQIILDTEISMPIARWLELALLYTQRPDARLGFFADHGGMVGLEARVPIDSRLRLLASSFVGAGVEAFGGLEASW